MATTTVSDALVTPQSQGTGLGSEDDQNSAATIALLAEHVGGEYVGGGMNFQNHDGTADTVEVAPGYCYITDDSTSTSGQRGSGGNAQAQSTTSSGYDTEIPDNQVYLVVFPTAVTVDLSDSTLNQIWVNITDVTSNNAVEIRSDGGGGTTAAPTETFLKLGEANPDDSSADIRQNDRPQIDRLYTNPDTVNFDDSLLDGNTVGMLAENENVDDAIGLITSDNPNGATIGGYSQNGRFGDIQFGASGGGAGNLDFKLRDAAGNVVAEIGTGSGVWNEFPTLDEDVDLSSYNLIFEQATGGISYGNTQSTTQRNPVVNFNAQGSDPQYTYSNDILMNGTRALSTAGAGDSGAFQDRRVEIHDPLAFISRSTDPPDPPNGQSRWWQADGNGASGADGDIMVKITNDAGTTKTATLIDFSAQ